MISPSHGNPEATGQSPPKSATRLMRVPLLVCVCLASVLTFDPSLARAGGPDDTPCAHLQGHNAERYNALVDSSVAHYKAKRFANASEDIVALKRICDDDPRLDFNLARAYQNAGNCNMARYWFERLLERIGDNRRALAKKRPRLAEEALTELEQVCTHSARIELLSTIPELQTTLTATSAGGGTLTLSAPFRGRIDGGEYTVRVTHDGVSLSIPNVVIAPNRENIIALPTPPSKQALAIVCPAAVSSVTVSPPPRETELTSASLACGDTISLEPGTWRIDFSVAGVDFSERVIVPVGNEVDLHLTTPLRPDTEFARSDWGWLAIAGGTTLALTGGSLVGLSSMMEADVLTVTDVDPATSDATALEPGTRDFDDRGATMHLAGIITAGVGAATLSTGVILLLMGDEPEDDDARAHTLSIVPLASNGLLLHSMFRF